MARDTAFLAILASWLGAWRAMSLSRFGTDAEEHTLEARFDIKA